MRGTWMRLRARRAGSPTRHLLLAALLGTLGPLAGLEAAAPRVEVELRPTRVYLGAPAVLSVEVDVPEGTEVDMTSLARSASGLPGLRPRPVESAPREGGRRLRFRADLVRFELGAGEGARAFLPWRRGEEEGTLELWLPAPEVVAVPARPGDGEGRLRAAKGEVRPTPTSPLLWLLAGLGGLALVSGGWWLGRRGPAEVAPAEPPEPPFEKAMRLLARLAEEGDQGDPRSFHYRLSEILREYLSGRFLLAGLSETSFEIMEECRGANLEASFLERLGPLLDSMDRIKFGPEDAPSESSGLHLAACQDLVRATEPPPPEEEAPAASEVPAPEDPVPGDPATAARSPASPASSPAPDSVPAPGVAPGSAPAQAVTPPTQDPGKENP